MVPRTVGPRARTASRAAEVLQCSRMMRSFGKRSCNAFRVGRKAGSALRIVMALVSFVVEECAWAGVDGTSPWRFSTMSCFSISSKTG
jgi:hypothetical protein